MTLDECVKWQIRLAKSADQDAFERMCNLIGVFLRSGGDVALIRDRLLIAFRENSVHTETADWLMAKLARKLPGEETGHNA
jgi:hypothetical protein